MSSPVVDNKDRGGGGIESDAAAVHRTRWPLQTNAMVPRQKSQRIGLSDSNHWTPKTISKEPSSKS
jgi:hypothetical protein